MFLGIIKFGRSISGDKKKNIILHSIRNMKLGVCSEGWYKNYFNKVNCNESMTLRSVYKHLMPSKIRNKNKCCERTHQKRIDNNSRNVSVIILHRKFNAVSLSFSRISYTRKVLFLNVVMVGVISINKTRQHNSFGGFNFGLECVSLFSSSCHSCKCYEF